MFPIVPYIKSHLPFKFHENPFSRFPEMLLTDRQTNRQTRATDKDENITFAMAEVTSGSKDVIAAAPLSLQRPIF